MSESTRETATEREREREVTRSRVLNALEGPNGIICPDRAAAFLVQPAEQIEGVVREEAAGDSIQTDF